MRTIPLAITGLAVLALAACGSSDPGGDVTATDPGPTVIATPDPNEGAAPTLDLTAGSSVIGLPAEFGTGSLDAAAGAARTSDDGLIAIVTYGSSTCPQVPDTPATGSDSAVTVTFPEPTDGPCTMDYVPATTVVALPEGVADGDLTVTIGEIGTVTLPAGSTEPVWVPGS